MGRHLLTVTYLLDNNVLSYFLNAGRKADPSGIASRDALAIVEEVDAEARNDTKRGGEYRKWIGRSGIDVRSITAGSQAATLLGLLKKPTSGLKDLGELASIALCTEDAALVLVTNDKEAIRFALRELITPGEHVISFTTFVRRVADGGGLDRATVEAVAAKAQVAAAPPTWWPTWISTLP